MKYRNDFSVELIETWGSDDKIARAARVSTGSDQLENQKIRGLIRYLIQNDHTSPVEHSGATFRLEVPLFVRDQIVRHRTFSYNIKSFRFGEADPEFYVPSQVRPLTNEGSGAHPVLTTGGNEALSDVTQDAHKYVAKVTWSEYCALLERGVAEEVARNVLPTSTYTQMYMTGNLWNWIGFLDKRIESERNRPQWEIEIVAKSIKSHLESAFPVTMEAVNAHRPAGN